VKKSKRLERISRNLERILRSSSALSYAVVEETGVVWQMLPSEKERARGHDFLVSSAEKMQGICSCVFFAQAVESEWFHCFWYRGIMQDRPLAFHPAMDSYEANPQER
jgi:hypothetical protein